MIDGLRASGWTVDEHPVGDVVAVLRELPDGALVLLDGLIGSAAPDALAPEAARLRLVLLVHLPLADERERAALAAVRAVVTTSSWTARFLRERCGRLPVEVAEPGVDPAPLAPGTPGGRKLICVGAVTRIKGHDVLLDALAEVPDARCTCVGSLDREPGFVAALRPPPNVRFTGPLVGADLDTAYAAADVLVLASRQETYGMVLTEALARGLPIIATDVGGVSETLDGRTTALLVPPDDPAALAAAIRRWLAEPQLRAELRENAATRRETLRPWDAAVQDLARILAGVAGSG